MKAKTVEPEVKVIETEVKVVDVPKFSKKKILESNWYSHKRDILTVALKDGELYTHTEIDKIFTEFMKGGKK